MCTAQEEAGRLMGSTRRVCKTKGKGSFKILFPCGSRYRKLVRRGNAGEAGRTVLMMVAGLRPSSSDFVLSEAFPAFGQ